jgi:hypothetical protein
MSPRTGATVRDLSGHPLLKHWNKTLKPILNVFKKGLIIDTPNLRIERRPDGRVQPKLPIR